MKKKKLKERKICIYTHNTACSGRHPRQEGTPDRKAPQTGRHPRQQTTEKQPRSNRAGKIQEGAAIIAPEIYG